MIFPFYNWTAETVIYRIFYYINRAGNGQLTLKELKRGNLVAAMQQADEEEDINKVLRYTWAEFRRKVTFAATVDGSIIFSNWCFGLFFFFFFRMSCLIVYIVLMHKVSFLKKCMVQKVETSFLADGSRYRIC